MFVVLCLHAHQVGQHAAKQYRRVRQQWTRAETQIETMKLALVMQHWRQLAAHASITKLKEDLRLEQRHSDNTSKDLQASRDTQDVSVRFQHLLRAVCCVDACAKLP